MFKELYGGAFAPRVPIADITSHNIKNYLKMFAHHRPPRFETTGCDLCMGQENDFATARGNFLTTVTFTSYWLETNLLALVRAGPERMISSAALIQ